MQRVRWSDPFAISGPANPSGIRAAFSHGDGLLQPTARTGRFFVLTIARRHDSERSMKTGKTTKEANPMSRISDRLTHLAATAAFVALALPGMALAQDTDREPGTPYVAEVFNDWELRCITAAEEGQPERCEMFQLLLDEQDNPVAVFRLSVPLVETEDVVAAAIIVTPLETLLTPGIRVRIDDSEPVGIPFTLCEETGCLARIPLSQENVEAFKAGGDTLLDIFALARSDLGEIGGVPVALSASLRGFTAAYDAMQERHEAFAALIAEIQAESVEDGAADAEAGDAESE
jgi:invasion protein IalB